MLLSSGGIFLNSSLVFSLPNCTFFWKAGLFVLLKFCLQHNDELIIFELQRVCTLAYKAMVNVWHKETEYRTNFNKYSQTRVGAGEGALYTDIPNNAENNTQLVSECQPKYLNRYGGGGDPCSICANKYIFLTDSLTVPPPLKTVGSSS